MSPTRIALLACACIFGGGLLGLSLRRWLPEHHLSPESKDVVKLAIAVVATMSALVLSLLIASAKSSHDMRRSEFTQMSADIILLDRSLAHYGPETKNVRLLLRQSVDAILENISAAADGRSRLGPWGADEARLHDGINELSPHNEIQHSMQAQAVKVIGDLGHRRWLLFAETGSAVPMPFLFVLIFWLTIIFASFGLFAPVNGTVVATFFVCALSLSGAIFLILELDRSFAGLMQISDGPLREALVHLVE